MINHHIFIGRSDCGTVGDCLVHDYRRTLVLGSEMFFGHFDGQQGGDRINCGDSKTNVVSSA